MAPARAIGLAFLGIAALASVVYAASLAFPQSPKTSTQPTSVAALSASPTATAAAAVSSASPIPTAQAPRETSVLAAPVSPRATASGAQQSTDSGSQAPAPQATAVPAAGLIDGAVETAGARTSQPPFYPYEVQPGDTVLSIASRYGVAARSISVASGLTDADALSVGDVLTVPSQSGWLYRVQANQSLDVVAAEFGVPVELVRSANPSLGSGLPPVNTVVLIPYPEAAISLSK